MDSTMSHLVDPSSKNYLCMSLQKCHNTRVSTYIRIFNISVFLLFIFGMGASLYYLYKRKPSEYDKYQKMIEDQKYIMSKIRFYQGSNLHTKATNLTQLPLPEEDYYSRMVSPNPM
jgi:glucan phosphoethanolaminetransferase (alkaline phosphatase superfamily)